MRMSSSISTFPEAYQAIFKKTEESDFTMASDIGVCTLLRTLAASKPNGFFLELGTGTGLSTCWILEGMDQGSSLISVDNDARTQQIASEFLGNDKRLQLKLEDAGLWLENNSHKQFDFIFADTWHGKYLMLDNALDMLKPGGLYIIDDMLPQPNWPDGHHDKAENLINILESHDKLLITKIDWSTGIFIAAKK
jgi:predicted O-methyltransferase YrrM